LAPFLLAAGTAGSSAFFVKLRPFLLAGSVLFVAFVFISGGAPNSANASRVF